jgi:hypothetical protein
VAGDAIDVPDWEYDRCIAAGWAEHADPPAPPKAAKAPKKKPEPAVVAVTVLEVNEAGHPTGNVAPAPPFNPDTVAKLQAAEQKKAPEPAEEAVPEPPRPADPKPDWVDYAVTRGMAPEKAALLSKADLMSRYGGRL